MGCSIKKTYRDKTTGKIDCLEKVAINPGLFIKKNPNNFSKDFKFGAILSKRKKSVVRQCINRDTGDKRIVKIKQKHSFKVENEIEILKNLDHPNIVKLLEYYEDEKRVFMVMESCEGQEMFSEILSGQILNENKIAIMMQQLLSVLAYLHDKQIIHRNLTPNNILIENSKLFNIKLLSFSHAIKYTSIPITGISGSQYFASPEMLTSSYSEKTDLWSLGVIFCLLLSGDPPYKILESKSFQYLGPDANFGFSDEIWVKTSSAAKDLLASLLCEQSKRISAKDCLSHPWLVQNLHKPICNESLKLTVLQKLKNFHAFHKLREAVYSFIISQLVTVDETRLLKEVFKDIDKNGDGRISVNELAEEYSKILESDEALVEAEKIMKEVDSDNSGFIDYTEFLKVNLSSQKVLSSKRLKKAFRMFDKDESGFITALELKDVLQGDLESDEIVWRNIISIVDQNRDGEIDLHEFQDIIFSKCLELK